MVRRIVQAALAAFLLASCNRSDELESSSGDKPPIVDPQPQPTSTAAIVAERQELDSTVFAGEVEAQRHEKTFVAL